MNAPALHHSPESAAQAGQLQPTPSLNATIAVWHTHIEIRPVALLALMMVLVPALGVPSDLMVQDTLKSVLVAFGVLLSAVAFFWQQRHRHAPLRWHGLVWLPLLLTIYALASMAWSHAYLAAVETIRWFLLSLLLWLGLNTLRRRVDTTPLAWGIHTGAVLASLWAVLQFWFAIDLFPQAALPASTFINRNFFAEYLVTTLPFSVYVLTQMRANRWLGLVAFTVALNVVALMMTGTRSALVAMLVLGPVLAITLVKYRAQFRFAQWRWPQRLLVGYVLVVGVFGMGSIPSSNARILVEKSGTTALQRSLMRTSSIGDKREYSEGSFSIRSTMWKATARMIIANPLLGVGAGAWEVQIPIYQNEGELSETDFYAHNELLQLLSEYGVVVGGLFLATMIAYLLLAARKTWRLQGVALVEAPLRALTLSSLLALLVVSNAGFPWRLASTGALLALGLAILAASDARLGFTEAFYSARLPWRPGFSQVTLLVLVVCLLLTGHITQQAAEVERKITRSMKLLRSSMRQDISDPLLLEALKAAALKNAHEGIAINPHYRKLTPVLAQLLALQGDWADSVWVWESIAASRPNVPAFWYNLTIGHMRLNQNAQAWGALKKLTALQAHAPGARALEVILLSRTGHLAQATQMLADYYQHESYDYDLVQAGYTIGCAEHDWALAIRSLELRNQHWPEQAADADFKQGSIYANAEWTDDAKALTAFRAGLQRVPTEKQESYRQQVPEKYRSGL